ncbi:MAG: MFS transporter [Streptosporangiales bacterium]
MTGSSRPVHPLLLPVVLTATFMQLLDVTIVQVGISSLQRDLHTTADTVQLVLAGYTLTYACLLIVAARMGDRYGYRRLFLVGIATFTVASLACSLAPTVEVLIAARLLQGASSGVMAPQVLSLIQVAVPARRRSHALGLLGATMGIASLTGPLLGGVLLNADLFGLGWRLIFLVNLPVGLLALLGSHALPTDRAAGRPRLDGAGATLAAAGLGLLIFPLTLGRDMNWPMWTWLCFVGAAAALVLFVRTQRRSSEPLLHPAVFRDRATVAGLLLVFVFNAGVPSFTYLLLLYLQAGLGYSPVTAALTSMPFAAAAIIGSRVSARLARRYGTPLLTVAVAILALVMVCLAPVIGAAGYRWATLPLLAIGGASFGVFTASVFSLVLAGIASEATGSVSGLLPTAQQLGGTIGVTLAGLVYFAAANYATAFGDAMLYEAGIFVLTAGISYWFSRHRRRAAARSNSPAPSSRRRTYPTERASTGHCAE